MGITCAMTPSGADVYPYIQGIAAPFRLGRDVYGTLSLGSSRQDKEYLDETEQGLYEKWFEEFSLKSKEYEEESQKLQTRAENLYQERLKSLALPALKRDFDADQTEIDTLYDALYRKRAEFITEEKYWERKITQAKKEADYRSYQLLLDVVGQEGLQDYLDKGYIIVPSKVEGYSYKIDRGRVKIRKGEKVIGELCIVATVQYPEQDRISSLVLIAKDNEEELFKIGNPVDFNNIEITKFKAKFIGENIVRSLLGDSSGDTSGDNRDSEEDREEEEPEEEAIDYGSDYG